MDTVIVPQAVKLTFVVIPAAPVKAATKPEVKAVVAEVSRAINSWLYS